jgi:hypothetical protein
MSRVPPRQAANLQAPRHFSHLVFSPDQSGSSAPARTETVTLRQVIGLAQSHNLYEYHSALAEENIWKTFQFG